MLKSIKINGFGDIKSLGVDFTQPISVISFSSKQECTDFTNALHLVELTEYLNEINITTGNYARYFEISESNFGNDIKEFSIVADYGYRTSEIIRVDKNSIRATTPIPQDVTIRVYNRQIITSKNLIEESTGLYAEPNTLRLDTIQRFINRAYGNEYKLIPSNNGSIYDYAIEIPRSQYFPKSSEWSLLLEYIAIISDILRRSTTDTKNTIVLDNFFEEVSTLDYVQNIIRAFHEIFPQYQIILTTTVPDKFRELIN